MGLNSRKAQIVWGLVPLVLAGLVLAVPFVWRALKTGRPGDIRAAVGFGVAQVVVYAAFALDQSKGDEVSNLTAAVVWFLAFSAAVGAAYLYRPLSKEEVVDQAARDTRPGSSYL
jgi:ABC-type methionine transport system permease subunit